MEEGGVIMSAGKKRNKRYVPKAAKIPGLLQVQMTSEAHPQLAMQLYAALIMLIDMPSVEACNRLSHQLCCIAGGMSYAINGKSILGRTDAASIAIRSAIAAIEGIINRAERAKAVHVTDFEAKTLRAAAGKLDDALSNIPLPCYTKAVREIEAITGVRA